MSDIKEGDLVMVVRPQPCCGSSSKVGRIFKVTEVFFSKAHGCTRCGFTSQSVVAVDGQRLIRENGTGGSFQLSRLKKINPPALSDTTTSEKELDHA